VAFSSLLVSYVVSFYVIAQFWLAHHRVFRLVRGHSETLAWWNFLFLFTITLFPFSSALLGKYPDNSFAVIEFSANLLLASLSTTLVIFLARQQQLLVPEATPIVTTGIWTRGAAMAAVIALSIVVACFSASNAKYVWILLVVAPRLARRGSRSAADRAARADRGATDTGPDTAPNPEPGTAAG
jgi:uncharacterized membrane protein